MVSYNDSKFIYMLLQYILTKIKVLFELVTAADGL